MTPTDDDLDTWLRGELTPVATSAARAGHIRARAHAELRRAGQLHQRSVRTRQRLRFVVEASTALAAGATYVVWTALQLWPR
jgi:hypothetical protein